MPKWIIVSLSLLSTAVVSGKDSISVIFFLLDDCVICRDYAPQINQLHKAYGGEMAFVGYFPNFSSKADQIDAYRNTFNVKFPLKTDYFKTQALKYGAEVLPEVVVYNHTTTSTLYQGRIDNTFERLGRRRKVTTKHELKNVLEALHHSKPYTGPSKTMPVGCYINYTDQLSDLKN